MDATVSKRHHYVPHSKFICTDEVRRSSVPFLSFLSTIETPPTKDSVTINENSPFLALANPTDYVKVEQLAIKGLMFQTDFLNCHYSIYFYTI